MAKKTFKSNPAMQFISEASEPEQDLDQAQEQITVSAPATAPDGYKLNPMYIEKKSKRLQLVLQPSLFDRVKKTADERGLSVNEFCHQILDEATKGE